jgi:hypothetical protein
MPNLFDERAREILADILEQTHGSLDGLNAKRYRIDHIDDLERLDMLTHTSLLDLGYAHETLRVGPVGLYFIQSATRDALLADIDRVLNYLRELYHETLDQPVRLAGIAQDLDLDRGRVEECISYVRRCVPFVGTVNLHEPDACAVPIESLMQFGKFEEFLAARARSWFPEAYKSNRHDAKPHVNTVVHASKRDQVLGAALAAIVHWPDECKRGNSLMGARIATLIDQKAKLWWTESEAPLSIDIMASLINQHLKLPA